MELARQSGAKTIWGRATRTTSSSHHNSTTGQNQIKHSSRFFFLIMLCFVVTFQCCLLPAILTKYWIFSNSPLTIKDNLKGCVYFVKWCNMWNNRSLLFNLEKNNFIPYLVFDNQLAKRRLFRNNVWGWLFLPEFSSNWVFNKELPLLLSLHNLVRSLRTKSI